MLFNLKPDCPSLSDLDSLYQEAISELPIPAKKEYCERLISRAEYELQHTSCPEEIHKWKLLLRSARKEASMCLMENKME